MFISREEAGRLLGAKITITSPGDTLVVGIPRGGVVVAKAVAEKLGLPMDIVTVKKIGAPSNEELAIGAVGPKGAVYWDKKLCLSLGIKAGVRNQQLKISSQEREERERMLRGENPALDIGGKIVILVDDGVATGATVLAAWAFLRREKVKKVTLATPVIAKDTLEKMKKYFTKIIFLAAPRQFYAVGQFYQNFPQVSDEEVRKILQ